MKNLPKFEINDFQKSSFCTAHHKCVAVAHKDGVIALHDTKNPQLAPLYFNKEEWEGFISGVKNNEFDF